MDNPVVRNVLAVAIFLVLVGGVVSAIAEQAGREAGERDAGDGRGDAAPTTTLRPVTTTTPVGGGGGATTTTTTTAGAGAGAGAGATTTTARPATTPTSVTTTTTAPRAVTTTTVAGASGGRRKLPHTGGPSLLLPGLAGLATAAGLARVAHRGRGRGAPRRG